MRTILLVILGSIAFAGGCGDSRDSVQPGDAGIVVSASRDRNAGVSKAELSIDGTRRWLVVERPKDAPYSAGLSARLLDEGGAELVRVEFAWPEDGRDALWFKEVAGGNSLVCHSMAVADRVSESYVVDGDEFTVEYPVLSETAMHRAGQLLLSGRVAATEDARTAEYVDALVGFDRFVARHRDTALNDNPDGELLMDLLADRSIIEATLGVERPNPELPSERANRACLIAGTCAALKCMLGGLLNFICTACGGMSAACTIADWACWLAVDCN